MHVGPEDAFSYSFITDCFVYGTQNGEFSDIFLYWTLESGDLEK